MRDSEVPAISWLKLCIAWMFQEFQENTENSIGDKACTGDVISHPYYGTQKVLDKDGVFVLEHADLLSLLKFNLFDTICQDSPDQQCTSTTFLTSETRGRILQHVRFFYGNKEINKWMRMLTHNQFTIREIEDGIAFKVLQEQI